MLAYRHAYHAGSAADVLKHAAVAAIATQLAGKDKPLFYLESHAGAGSYDLADAAARKLGEHERGIGRLWQVADPPALLAPYLAAIAALNPDGQLRHYPGSPALARHCLRADARIELWELHPADHALLAAATAGDRRVRVERGDGYAALRSRLPPRERRGLVVVDPSYEMRSDYADAPRAIADGWRRFATGVFVLWYPLAGDRPVHRLLDAVRRIGCPRLLLAELETRPAQAGLRGSGVAILNPPWQLDDALAVALPWLARRLGDAGARWRLERPGA